jgi:lysylphosphatidylglycerol synthetase-like protein (DUF2156 family)
MRTFTDREKPLYIISYVFSFLSVVAPFITFFKFTEFSFYFLALLIFAELFKFFGVTSICWQFILNHYDNILLAKICFYVVSVCITLFILQTVRLPFLLEFSFVLILFFDLLYFSCIFFQCYYKHASQIEQEQIKRAERQKEMQKDYREAKKQTTVKKPVKQLKTISKKIKTTK